MNSLPLKGVPNPSRATPRRLGRSPTRTMLRRFSEGNPPPKRNPSRRRNSSRGRHSMRIRFLTLTLLALALCTLHSPSWGGETLRANFTPGLSFRFEQQNEFSMKLSAGGFDIEQQTEQQLSGSAKVLGVEDGIPSRLQVSLDPSCRQKATSMGQTMSPPLSIAGKTFTVEIEENQISQMTSRISRGSRS